MNPVDRESPLSGTSSSACARLSVPPGNASRQRAAAVLIWINQFAQPRAYKRRMHVPVSQNYCRQIRTAEEWRNNTELDA